MRETPLEARRALYEEAGILLGKSQDRTPGDRGTLKAGHTVAQPVIGGRDISVTLY